MLVVVSKGWTVVFVVSASGFRTKMVLDKGRLDWRYTPSNGAVDMLV